MTPAVIALHGHAGVGKDTLASFLQRQYGHERIAFADPIRELLLTIDPILETLDGRRLSFVVAGVGWDKAKQHPEIRQLLQNLGNTLRQCGYEDIWVDIAVRKMRPNCKYVITDVRYPNEVTVLADRLGMDLLLVKIRRPGVGPVNSHVSDAGLPDSLFDIMLDNDGTVEDLQRTFHFTMLRWSQAR